MLTFFKYCLLFSITLLFFWSCEQKEQECYQPLITSVKAGFMTREIRDSIIVTDTSTRDTTIYLRRDTGLIAPIFFTINESPALMIPAPKGATVIAFPLNPDNESMQYLIKADSTSALADTLTVNYTTTLKFINNDCGFTNFFNINGYHCTSNVFDSVALQTDAVTNVGSDRHLLLYIFKK